MIYIDPKPNASGAYPNPKGQPFPGCIPVDDAYLQTIIQYNGFVTIVSTDPVVIEPDVEAWEAWKASLPPEVAPEPTDTEVLNVLLGVI